MSSYEDLLSHPNKLLYDHLHSVGNLSKVFSQNTFFSVSEDIHNIHYLIGLLHDYGKATNYFQAKLKKLQKDHVNNELYRHALLSAIPTFFVIHDYALEHGLDSYYPYMAYSLVKHHHTNLNNVINDFGIAYDNSKFQIIDKQLDSITNNDFISTLRHELKNYVKSPLISPDELKESLNEFKSKLKKFKRNRKFWKNLKLTDATYYIQAFSILIDADKLEASQTDISLITRHNLSSNTIEQYVQSLPHHGLINKYRSRIFEMVKERANSVDINKNFFSMTLPTGFGKTLNSLYFAVRLRERIFKKFGYIPRIIYCLPFTSIIDQNYLVYRDVFNNPPSEKLIKHHHLGDTIYKFNNDTEFDDDKSMLLIEGWNSEIVITTFVQLFFTILGNRNRTLRKYHNLSGSIIILDEVQAIPSDYWKVFQDIAKALAKEYNIKFLLITATQPKIFNSTVEIIDDVPYYFDLIHRYDLHIDLTARELSQFSDELIDFIKNSSNPDFLIILNTRNSAKEVYHAIKSEFDNVFFLSSLVIPKQRSKLIHELSSVRSQDRILVSTQIVEAGVDVDFQNVIRDMAPLDSIVQAAGRCNRHAIKEIGNVYLFDLKLNGRSLSSYIYDTILLNGTRNILTGMTTIRDSQLYSLIDDYFDYIVERKSSQKSSELEDYVRSFKFEKLSDFSLIKEQFDMIDIFVEFDDEASQVLEKYKSILYSDTLSRFEKRSEFRKIRPLFMQYVISVPRKDLGALSKIGGVYYLSKSEIGRQYLIDEGFVGGSSPFIF